MEKLKILYVVFAAIFAIILMVLSIALFNSDFKLYANVIYYETKNWDEEAVTELVSFDPSGGFRNGAGDQLKIDYEGTKKICKSDTGSSYTIGNCPTREVSTSSSSSSTPTSSRSTSSRSTSSRSTSSRSTSSRSSSSSTRTVVDGTEIDGSFNEDLDILDGVYVYYDRGDLNYHDLVKLRGVTTCTTQ